MWLGSIRSRNAARVYKPAEFAHYPDSASFPQARIHTDARALLAIVAVRLLMQMAVWLAFWRQETAS